MWLIQNWHLQIDLYYNLIILTKLCKILYLISCSQDGKGKNREEEENHKKEVQMKKKQRKLKKAQLKEVKESLFLFRPQ